MGKDPKGQIVPAVELEKALMLHRSDRLDEAEFLYRKVLRIIPHSLEAQLLLGILLHQNGSNEEALGLLEQVLSLEPDLAIALLNKGNILSAIAKPNEALQTFNRAMALYPGNADLLIARGAVYVTQRRFGEALADLDQALLINPIVPEAFFNKGNALQGLKRYTEAVENYNCAIKLQPERAQWYCHRANALRVAGRPVEALADTDTALRLDPNNAEALNDRGNVLQELSRLEEAVISYNRALALRPDYIEALNNRGTAYKDLKRIDEAVADFDRVLEISPGHAQAQWSKGIVKLLIGQLREGLALYEWRKKMPAPIEARHYDKPLWTGDLDLNGKTLFLYIEQGLGDTFQFFRYAILAKSRGARVIVSVHRAIMRILQDADPNIEIIDAATVPPSFDFHAPLMSLPHAFGTSMQSIPTAIPYLRPDKERTQKWAERIGPDGFKIGICWQAAGSIVGRSFPLAELSSVSRLPGIRLISLQKGPSIGRLGSLPNDMVVESLGDDFDAGSDAFLDTAAILPSLDLVITADTSVAHLAGTLNCPTWVALKYVPDWRWFLDRSDSPWYPSLRLFRQAAPGDWTPVFAAIKDDLVATSR